MNYAEQQRNPLRNWPVLAVVVVGQLALLYLVVTVLGVDVVAKIKAPLETKIVEQPKPPPPPDVPPPPPPPQMAAPPPPYIPPPEVQVATPPPQNAIAAVSRTPPPTTAYTKTQAVSPTPDHDVSERPISGGSPDYPAEMQENNREGEVNIGCDVDPSGHTSNCAVISVKGGQAFAASALSFVRRETYSPAMHNGKPVPSHRVWAIKFRLGE